MSEAPSPRGATLSSNRQIQVTARILSRQRVLQTLIRWASAVGLVYFGIAVPFTETAGRETALTLVYEAVIGGRLHLVLPYTAAAAFAYLWRQERKTRINAVRRENRRNSELERELDRHRSSSRFKE